jgi:hypothetical protein
MVIVGTIIWMIISGSVMAKIGKILKGTQLAQNAGKGMGRVQDVITTVGGSAKDSVGAGVAVAKAKVGSVVDKCSDGLAKRIRRGYGDEVVDCSDEVLQGAAIRTGKYGDIADEIVNVKKMDEFLAKSAGKYEWDADTLLALDKILGKYGDDAVKMKKIKKLADQSDKIDGNGIQSFIKSWGNSLDTPSKGIDGYAAQFDEVIDQLDTLSDSQRMVVGNLEDVMYEGVPRKVELDIQINNYPNGKKNPDFIEATEIKNGDVSLTGGKYGTKSQIGRQKEWLKNAPSESTLRWKFNGKYSQPVLDELKQIKFAGKNVEVYYKGGIIYSYYG